MSNPKRTSTVDIGVLNPPQARSGATKRKYDPIEDKEGLLNIMWDAARKETYDTTSRAVIMCRSFVGAPLAWRK